MRHRRQQPQQQQEKPDPQRDPVFMVAESKAMLDLARTLDAFLATKDYAKAAKA